MLAQNFAGANFMGRIHIRMQEGNRHGFDVLFGQLAGNGNDGFFIESAQHRAFDVDAFRHREAPGSFDQSGRFFDEDIVLVVTTLVGNFERIAKAIGGDQCRACTLAFDDGIGGQSSAVQEHIDIGEAKRCFGKHMPHAGNDSLLGRPRRGQHFGGNELFASLQDDIGKSAADISCNPDLF